MMKNASLFSSHGIAFRTLLLTPQLSAPLPNRRACRLDSRLKNSINS